MDTSAPYSPSQGDTRASHAQTWGDLFTQTIFASFFYVFMEWLFFVTKESSLSKLTPWNACLVLLVTAGVLMLASGSILAVAMIFGTVTCRVRGQQIFQGFAQVVPALIWAVTALLMVDNFSYTLFKFGVVTTQGGWRLIYTLGFLLLFGIFWRKGRGAARARVAQPRAGRRWRAGLTMGLAAISLGAILHGIWAQKEYYGQLIETYTVPATRRPNIIILGSDGLSASHLSVYGYERDTTPFLRQMAARALLARHHFTNASSTSASTTAVLTGREPINVDVMRYPDILEGEDSYRHLPGILKQYGYTTIQVGVPSWVDAHTLNLLNGFDSINGQPLDPPLLGTLRRYLGDSQAPYFLWTIAQRASERLKHIFFLRVMENPVEVAMNAKARIPDQQRVDLILSKLELSKQPVYIFAHFMDTHGPEFAVQKQVFSQGDVKDQPWNVDFYDDSILGFDSYVKQIYAHLQEKGLLDETILIIYTDHGLRYATNVQLPLIMRFPEGEYAGDLDMNSANIDIPATLLDYMGLPKPAWMGGLSLIGEQLSASREIFSITSGSPKKVIAPFYQIKIVQLVFCHRWYRLNVQENSWEDGDIVGYTPPCPADQQLGPEAARQKIIQYLRDHGYDVSSLAP